MEHFVTLFDSNFVPQGMALHASLTRHAEPFTLWVLCMDNNAKVLLDTIGSPSIRTIALSDVETHELLTVRSERTRAEYCWTLTSLTPKLVFDRDLSVSRVTYLDADLYLLKSVRPIFAEFEATGKSVLITDHAYDPDYDQEATSGRYCVQFMTFVRDASEPVRHWWHERCLEWCFDRVEEGKFGDQKYLDDWPTRFSEHVHVLTQLDAILAPWNARRFPCDRALVWHFHSLRLLPKNRVLLHRAYSVPDEVDRVIYLPYIKELKQIMTMLNWPVVQRRHAWEFLSPLAAFLRGLSRLLRDVLRFNTVRDLPHK